MTYSLSIRPTSQHITHVNKKRPATTEAHSSARCARSRLLRQRLALADLAPLAAARRQALDAADTAGPQALAGRAEGVAALAADDADGLQHRLARVAPEHGRVPDPLEAALELRVERGQRLRVHAGRRRGGRRGHARRPVGPVGAGLRRRARVGRGRQRRREAVRRVAGVHARVRRAGAIAGGRGRSLGGLRRQRRQATLGQALENGARLVQQMVGALVVALGYEAKRARQHVARQQLHAPLHDGRVRRDGRRRWAAAWRALRRLRRRAAGGQHGDGKQRRARQMRERTLTQNVAVAEVRLDQWDLLDAQHAPVVVLVRAAERLQAGHDALPMVLRQVLLG